MFLQTEGWQHPLLKGSTLGQLRDKTLSTFIHWATDAIYGNHMASTCDRRQGIKFTDHRIGKQKSNEQRMLKTEIS